MDELDYERLEAVWEQMKKWNLQHDCPPALAKLIKETIEPPYKDLMPMMSPRQWLKQIGPLVTMAFLAGHRYATIGDLPLDKDEPVLARTDCASMHVQMYKEFTKQEGDEQ